MAQAPLIYLDANIFIHAFEPSPQFGRENSNRLVTFLSQNAGSRKPVFRTSEFTFGELWVGPYKKQKDELIQLYENLSFSNMFLEVGPVTLEVIKGAARLRGLYSALKMPDALHISTAILFGCTYLLTSDARMKDTFELGFDRFGFSKRLRPVTVIRPDTKTLQRLTHEFSAID